MANEHDSFLKQIDEEVRRERLAKLWDRYGVLILGVVAAVFLVFGGLRLYQSEQVRAARQAGAQFTEANQLLTEKDKKNDAMQALSRMAKSGPEGYAMLAKFKLASIARSENKLAEAEQHYRTVANDTSADPLFRSFARLQIASLKLDTGSFTDVKNHLTDLIAEENPWRHSAREIYGLAALKAGKYSEARGTFRALLTAKDAPQDIAQRAHIVMAMIAREEIKAKAGTAPETPPAPKSEPAGQPAGGTTPPTGAKPEKKDGASTPTDATPK